MVLKLEKAESVNKFVEDSMYPMLVLQKPALTLPDLKTCSKCEHNCTQEFSFWKGSTKTW